MNIQVTSNGERHDLESSLNAIRVHGTEGNERHTYMVLVGKPEVLTRPKYVQLNNIKMDLKRKWISRHELNSSGSQQ